MRLEEHCAEGTCMAGGTVAHGGACASGAAILVAAWMAAWMIWKDGRMGFGQMHRILNCALSMTD